MEVLFLVRLNFFINITYPKDRPKVCGRCFSVIINRMLKNNGVLYFCYFIHESYLDISLS